MKENRKLLKEVLKDIRHDMTDEEVLNLALSCMAAIQAPLIMIEDLYDKVNAILAKQSALEKRLQIE